MGRAKLTPARKRHRRVVILVRPGEYRQWAKAAGLLDLTLSEFIRRKVLGGLVHEAAGR